jgi:UDP-3-O-[3-hydroxymyristoyl] glucosamine N-acyltransferase
MVDTRFHAAIQPIALAELLRRTGHADALTGELLAAGPETRLVAGAEELALATPQHVALAAHRDYLDDLRKTAAGVVVVAPALRDAVPESAIAVVSPRAHELFVDLLHYLYPADTRAVFVAGLSQEGSAPFLEQGVVIGPNVVIGPRVEIGAGTVIGANAVIGAGVSIGRDCLIGANCTIDCAYLGDRVVVQPGARIGTEGFGWLDFTRTNRKIPQLGRVILQDRVEIGANSTIDRGALGDTVVGDGTKIDNLVQVGHNCRIGRNCLIAAFTGLSGSTVVEDGVMFGGGAATAGHLTVGRGSVVYAWGGVTKDVPPGSRYAGFPAEDVRVWRRGIAAMRKLIDKDER